jgi:hypothetical protein
LITLCENKKVKPGSRRGAPAESKDRVASNGGQAALDKPLSRLKSRAANWILRGNVTSDRDLNPKVM